MWHSATKILKSKKGFSLIFVLCVMLMLLAVSASILTAASISSKSVEDKATFDQMNLYADSTAKVITHSLQHETSADINSPNMLGGKLLKEIYAAYMLNEKTPAYPSTLSFGLTTPLEDADISDLTLKFPKSRCQIVYSPAIDAVLPDADNAGSARVPASAKVDLTMELRFTVRVKSKQTTTVLTYMLEGAILEDDGTDLLKQNLPVKNLGEWRLTNIERADR